MFANSGKKFSELNEDGSVKPDENGNAIFTSDESRLEFAKELTELMNVEVEVNKLSIDELGDKIQLSAVDLASLEDLVE